MVHLWNRQLVGRLGIYMGKLSWSIFMVTAYQEQGPCKRRKQYQHPFVHSAIIFPFLPQPYTSHLPPALCAELNRIQETSLAHKESSHFRRIHPSPELPHPTAGHDSYS